MKVILEAQHACTSTPRGIAYYTKQLIQQLLLQKEYSYELTFFDYERERQNHKWIAKYFGDYAVPVHECNDLDYRVASRDDDAYSEKSYNAYTNTSGDVFHFFSLLSIPSQLQGQMVVTVHDMLPILYPAFFTPNMVTCFQLNADRLNQMRPHVVAVSQHTRQDVLELTNLPEENVSVGYQAYDKSVCFPQQDKQILQNLGVAGNYLLYLGAIDYRKNIIRIIDAFEKISGRYSGLALVLAGGGDPNADAVFERIDKSPARKHIVQTGYITDAQKRALYSSALGFLFPSVYEGFGIPVLEAMACGCPVITSNTTSLPEVAGDAAILIDPYNAEQLAFEMDRLVHAQTLREELSAKGLARSKQFTWRKTAEQAEQVYKNAMSI